MLLSGILSMAAVGLCWTIFGMIMGRAPKDNIPVPVILMLSGAIALAVSVPIGCVQGFPQGARGGIYLTFGALTICGFLNYFQLELMAQAMQRGPNGIIWCIIQASLIFPFFLGICCFGVPLTLWRLLGLIAILAALLLFGLGKKERGMGNWKLLTFSSFVITGIAQILSNLPSYFPASDTVSSVWRSAYFALGLMVGSAVLGRVLDRQFVQTVASNCRRPKVWLYCFLLEFFELGASFFLLYPGMDKLSRAGAGAIAYPVLVGSCLIGFEVFALLILHEKRKWYQYVALGLCLLGVIGIC